MPEETVRGALLEAMRIEKDAMDFYRRAARLMRDRAAREIFERLAEDEEAHVASFFDVYQGDEGFDLPAFLARDSGVPSYWSAAFDALMSEGFDDLKALQLAMLKERDLERQLRKTALTIRNPAVRAVYEVNADSTRQHALAIEAEYARLVRAAGENRESSGR